MVSAEVKYKFFKLVSDDSIEKFTQMIGTMAVFCIRKKLPRKDAELVIRNLDLVNSISRIYLYISASKMKVRLFTLRHIIGEASSCNRLSHQIGTPAPLEEENNNLDIQTRARTIIRLRSKFDYMGNVYEVVEELPNKTIRAVCKWGSLVGDEQHFNKDEILRLVNQNRGLN